MTERFGSRSNPNDNSSNNEVAAYKPEGNVFYDLFQIGNYDYSSGNSEAVWTIEGLDYDASVSSGFGTNYGTYASHYLLSGYYSLTFFVGPIFRDMKWNSQYQETNANACPFDGNVDTELYPGKANSAYLGGMSIGRVYPTNYLINKIWKAICLMTCETTRLIFAAILFVLTETTACMESRYPGYAGQTACFGSDFFKNCHAG